MKKFEVTATMDIGFKTIIEAESEDQAWAIARENEPVIGQQHEWVQSDEGHDWTLEDVFQLNVED